MTKQFQQHFKISQIRELLRQFAIARVVAEKFSHFKASQ